MSAHVESYRPVAESALQREIDHKVAQIRALERRLDAASHGPRYDQIERQYIAACHALDGLHEEQNRLEFGGWGQ